jgi:hypothetical protein
MLKIFLVFAFGLITCQALDLFNQDEMSTAKVWSSQPAFRRAHDSIKSDIICPSPIIEELIIIRGNTWGGCLIYRVAVCEELTSAGRNRNVYMSYHLIQNVNREERGPGCVLRVGPFQDKDLEKLMVETRKFVEDNLIIQRPPNENGNSRKQSLCLISIARGGDAKQIGIINHGTEAQWLIIDKFCLTFLSKLKEMLGSKAFDQIRPQEAK